MVHGICKNSNRFGLKHGNSSILFWFAKVVRISHFVFQKTNCGEAECICLLTLILFTVGSRLHS